MEPLHHGERAFHYRYVPYGTRFKAVGGERSVDEHNGDKRDLDERKRRLFANELAVDVGGVCWGHNGVADSVLDHHFRREDEGQFPSAAAAVLHRAADIAERFATRPGKIWLVSHVNPDFDAFCAMFLARQIISGELPAEGWEALGIYPEGWRALGDHRRQIDWFQPRVADVPPDRRWAVLLAANAACVDNCRRLACPKTRALHAVLYAAIERGRNYKSESSGALEFFSAVKHELQAKNLNPLYDSVLEGTHVFDRELRMLDHELEAYQRDLRRARQAIVFVQQADRPANLWAPEICQRPLIERWDESDKKVNAAVDVAHLQPAPFDLSPVDAIYLRDPECLLFKEWARYDVENSHFRQGFLFTAVAYSGGRASRFNNLDYYFALDPERAGARHLYNVWARLQDAECEKLLEAANKNQVELEDGPPRVGFEGRAAEYPAGEPWPGQADSPRESFLGPHAKLFKDPWFDGSNYSFTLVATPNRGTFIGQPTGNADLLDDPVVQLVRAELELGVFTSGVRGFEFSSEPGGGERKLRKFHISKVERHDERPPHHAGHYYRYAVMVSDAVPLLNRTLANQIGRTLWRVLEGEHGATVPDDFAERHLLGGADWLGVWSRRGIAVAYKRAATKRIVASNKLFAELVALSREAGALAVVADRQPGEMAAGRPPRAAAPGDHDSAAGDLIVAHGAHLTRRVADAKRRLAFPEARLLGRFFEASRLDEVLSAVHDLNLVSSEAAYRDRIEHLQGNVEWLEIFIVTWYAFEFFEHMREIYQGEPGHKAGPGRLTLGSAFGGLIVGLIWFWLLRPDKHSRFTCRQLLVVGLLGAAALAFLLHAFLTVDP
jgi:hypothetical protein